MIDFNFEEECCGCGACLSLCPVKAISWKITEDGFYIPDVDRSVCVRCGKCDQACPVLHASKEMDRNPTVDVWAAALKDKQKLPQSASGGAFYGLAASVIKEGGAVAGVIWDETMRAAYVVTDKWDQMQKMCGSKYVQAFSGRCIEEVSRRLQCGQKVLFSGTPCQIAGLVRAVGHPENLITCGIICEGVASPLVWKIYKNCLEDKYGAQLISAEMRSKRDGWSGGSSVYRFSNGKEVIKKRCFSLDPYIAGFIEGLFNRPCCKECRFKGVSENCDFLIGDFWGFTKEQKEKNENRGLSTVIACTPKGKNLWNKISGNFVCEQATYELVCNSNNVEHSGHWAAKRGEFISKVKRKPQSLWKFEYLVWSSANKLVKKNIMKILNKIGAF